MLRLHHLVAEVAKPRTIYLDVPGVDALRWTHAISLYVVGSDVVHVVSVAESLSLSLVKWSYGALEVVNWLLRLGALQVVIPLHYVARPLLHIW